MALLWFLAGLLAGAVVVGLWMRARVAELKSANEMGETFQLLADAALRSNQGAFLDAARSTLETVRAEMTGDLADRFVREHLRVLLGLGGRLGVIGPAGQIGRAHV